MIRIITMEREYGAGGSAIAQKLAERLNWKLWDTALTAEIARIARCDQGSVASLGGGVGGGVVGGRESRSLFLLRLQKGVHARQLRTEPAGERPGTSGRGQHGGLHAARDRRRGGRGQLRDCGPRRAVRAARPPGRLSRVRVCACRREDPARARTWQNRSGSCRSGGGDRSGTRHVREEVLRKGLAQPALVSSDDQLGGGGRCGRADDSG